MRSTRFSKCIAVLLAFTLFLPGLSGCARLVAFSLDPVVRAMDGYYAALGVWDFASCYQMLDTPGQNAISLQAFVMRYQTIWDALKIQTVRTSQGLPARVGEAYSAQVRLQYETADFGLLDFSFPITVSYEDDQWRLSWNHGMILEGLAADYTVRVDTLTGKRGEIIGADRTAWAVNAYAPTAYVRLARIDNADLFAVEAALALDMPLEEVLGKLYSARAIADGIALLKTWPVGEVDWETEQALGQIGIRIDRSTYAPVRYYPQGSTLAHLIGYTQPIDMETLETLQHEGYTQSAIIGRTGLEASYESTLRGINGKRIVLVNADGVIQKEIARVEPTHGLDLEITIDAHLQQTAHLLLEELAPGQSGAVVVLDPSTGAVLVSESAPTFDPNLFTFPISAQTWQEINAVSAPLFNRVTQALYPPGSTIKPLTAMAALQSGRFGINYVFPSNIGVIQSRTWVPTNEPWPYPGIKRVSDYWDTMNMTNAIIHSDNIYFAHLALEMGWTQLMKTLESVGFGKKLPFDVGVAASAVYTRESLENRKLLADTGYGQGELLISPLQMAVAFSALANKGVIMSPYVVGATKRMEGSAYATATQTAATPWMNAGFDARQLSDLETILHAVMVSGTGQSANVPGLTLFGKTGTAQVDDTGEKEIAWFISYVNSGGYNRLVCVALEVPPRQGQLRYKIAKEMMARMDASTPLPTLAPYASPTPAP